MMDRQKSLAPSQFTRFGDLLRYLRERAELTQRELALEVGYHYSYLSRIEKNERMPDSATLMARFVPALGLDDSPAWTARLLELATGQVLPAASPATPPPLAPPVPNPEAAGIFTPTPLPVPLTPLLGRESEIAALKNLILREDVRLVTLIGPPGVGKTRLATHLAAELSGNFAHGVLFVDLTPINEEEDVLPALAQSMGVQETSEIPLLTNLANVLKHKEMLLFIDNFEQVIQAASQLAQVLRNTPTIKCLVTSRETLRITGEHEFPLAPLPLPELPVTGQLMDNAETFEALKQYAVITLFAQRAQSVNPRFELTPETTPAVVEIVRRLDGLPLAIELAAARSRILSPQSMLTQFNRRFDWLGRASRESHSARATLRGAVEWSYNLLSDAERLLFQRLSVFAGGWTLTAAEAVCADERLPAEHILDLLVQLSDKSLVVVDLPGVEETRYRFLETMREFSLEKLEATGELTPIRDRYLAHYAHFAETVEEHLDGMGQVEWCIRAEQEHNNLRAALDWGIHPQASRQNGLRLAAAISLFWIERSYYHEGIHWLNQYLALAEAPEHIHQHAKILYRLSALYARTLEYHNAFKHGQHSVTLSRASGNQRYLASALFYMGDILWGLGDTEKARTTLEECISLCWSIPFPQQLNMALTSLGRLLDIQGEHERAISIVTEALSIAERIEDTWGTSYALHALGAIYRYNRKISEAIHCFERGLELTIKIGDHHAEGVVHANLSILYHIEGDLPRSGRSAERAYAVFQSLGNQIQQPFPLRMLAYSAIHAGNLVRARTLAQESLKGNRELGHLAGQLACSVALAQCELADGNVEQALQLCAMVKSYQRIENVDFLEPDKKSLETTLSVCRQKLTPAAFERAYAAGQALKIESLPL